MILKQVCVDSYRTSTDSLQLHVAWEPRGFKNELKRYAKIIFESINYLFVFFHLQIILTNPRRLVVLLFDSLCIYVAWENRDFMSI